MITGLETEYLVYERSESSTDWRLLERGDLDRLLLTEMLAFSSSLTTMTTSCGWPTVP